MKRCRDSDDRGIHPAFQLSSFGNGFGVMRSGDGIRSFSVGIDYGHEACIGVRRRDPNVIRAELAGAHDRDAKRFAQKKRPIRFPMIANEGAAEAACLRFVHDA